jgi:hypothetical protein
MTQYAFKNGVSPIDQDNMNTLQTQQSFNLSVRGLALIDSSGAGITENTLADNNYAMKFTLTASKTIGRIELHIDKDATGEDLEIEIRDSTFNTSGTADGTLLISREVPKEFVATTADYFSIPICLDLTASDYWIIAKKAGDAVNDIELIGEASASATYPVAIRAGTSGAWTTGQNQIHFKIYDNDPTAGDGQLIHEVYANTVYTNNYYDTDGFIASQQRYIKAVDGSDGIRETMTYTIVDGYIIGGDLT